MLQIPRVVKTWYIRSATGLMGKVHNVESGTLYQFKGLGHPNLGEPSSEAKKLARTDHQRSFSKKGPCPVICLGSRRPKEEPARAFEIGSEPIGSIAVHEEVVLSVCVSQFGQTACQADHELENTSKGCVVNACVDADSERLGHCFNAFESSPAS